MTPPAIPPLPPRIAEPPPLSQPPPPLSLPPLIKRPGVVLAFRLWCLVFVAIYIMIGTLEILIAYNKIEPDLDLMEGFVSHVNPAARAEIIAEKRADAPGFAAFTLVIATGYVFAAVLPRKPWAWKAGLIAIITTTFPFVLTAAVAVPLMIQWLKPEARRYFNHAR